MKQKWLKCCQVPQVRTKSQKSEETEPRVEMLQRMAKELNIVIFYLNFFLFVACYDQPTEEIQIWELG